MKRRQPMQVANISPGSRIMRLLWNVCQIVLYRWSPTPLHGWRRMILRIFGAKIGAHAHPYPRARIWAPWNLQMDDYSCLANDVDCYCVAPVQLGRHATVSQYSYLCTASHDYRDPAMPLMIAPIIIGKEAWIAADVFVGPGVNIGEGAVLGARSTAIHDIPAWSFSAGAPAKAISTRPVFERSLNQA